MALPSRQFSWFETIRAFFRPTPPPPGLARAGIVFLGLSLAAVSVLIVLGEIWYDNPHRYFGERKAGTYLSFLNLLATGCVAAVIAHRLGPMPFSRFWWATAGGFVWLGCDDLFTLHEQVDRGVHAVLGLDPDDPITDHLDDLIVAGYGVAALGLAYRYRAELRHLTWMQRTLAWAFGLFAAMVVVDFLHWSKTVEDGLKVVAGTLIFVGFFSAHLELRASAVPRRHATPVEGQDDFAAQPVGALANRRSEGRPD